MPKGSLAVTRDLPGALQNELEKHFSQVKVLEKGRPLTPKELKSNVKDTEVLICVITDRINEAVLKAAPKLRCVITYSVGLDHIDLAALKKRNIRLAHTPNVLTSASADLAWALIFGCARRIKAASRFVESGKFNGVGPKMFLGIELKGAKLGIIGLGRIGAEVARRGLAFPMEVSYAAARPSVHAAKLGIAQVSMSELLEMSDIVSLHCPLTPETKHLIKESELKKMKDTAILINTSRGPVVDEKALERHLKKHPEFHAGLDVFEREPKVSLPFAKLPNALCLPHIGSATFRTREEMGRICAEEAIGFAKSETLRYEYPL